MAQQPELLERVSSERLLMDALAGGEGGALALLGSAGVGKTAMLGWAVARAREQGFAVAEALASRMERSLPFGVLGQAIVALGGNPVEDVGELARAGGHSARFHRTLRWLGEVCASRPVLIAIDDLHWADPDSLELLAFLARRLRGLRALVVATLRAQPPAALALVRELADAGLAQTLVLEPLSRRGARDLLERRLGRALAEAEVAELWRLCAGSPLLLEAAASSLAEGRPLERLGRGAPIDSELLLARFAGIGDEGFEYVKAGAIFGVHFDHARAAALAGVSPQAADAALAGLVRAGVLADGGSGSISFVHPLFSQALLDVQPRSLRERRHAAAFRLVVEQGGPDALAAEHALLGAMTGDARAVEITARAGAAALAQGALAAASSHLENAVALAGAAAPTEVLLLRGQVLFARGEVGPLRELGVELLARDLPASARAQALCLLARAEALANRPAPARELFGEAAALAISVPERVDVLCDALLSCLRSAPAQWVLETASDALELAAEGTPQQRVLRFVGAYAGLLHRCEAADAAALAASVAGAGARSLWSAHGWTLAVAVHALGICMVLEDHERASAIFEREYAEAAQAGAPVLMRALAVAYADVLVRQGRLRAALELLEGAGAIGDRQTAPWSDLAAAVVLSELGRDDRARAHLEALRAFDAELAPGESAVVSLWLHLLDARAALAAGRHREASELMLAAAEAAELGGCLEPALVPWAQAALAAHLAAGRQQHARALLASLEARARLLPGGWPRAVAALGRARLAALEGERAEVDACFADALERFAALGQPLEHAQALLAAGTHLRRSGRPRDAREPLARALEICERAGAERIARTARAELAASGGRRRRRGDDDGASLTAQELRVAALAAEGLANGEIAAALHLSPKTVSSHLQRVYGKLGMHSRRELIRRAQEFSHGV